jgi:hypothetical protein
MPRVPIISYPTDQYISLAVTCPYHRLPEKSVPLSNCDVSLSSVSRRIRTAESLLRVPIISYPKDQYFSHTVTCPYHQLPEGSVPQSHWDVFVSSDNRRISNASHCDVSLSSVIRRISTAVTLRRVPIISYQKGQYRRHTVTCPYHQLPEVSEPQAHCDVSLSSVTRTISTAIKMWRVPIISNTKDQYRRHTVTCTYHHLHEGTVTQSYCKVSLSTVPWSISTAVTLWRVPVISYPKDQYRSHTVTCPYHLISEGSVIQSHCDVSLSSVTRRINTEVTLWRVHFIWYPKDQ